MTIIAQADGATFATNESITFEATTDGSATVTWTSDIGGERGSGTVTTTTPQDGVHTITATASLADATATDTIGLTVGAVAVSPTVSVTAIRQSGDSGRHLLVEIETQADGGGAVAGAALTAQIWHTDATGTATMLRDTVSSTNDGDGYASPTPTASRPRCPRPRTTATVRGLRRSSAGPRAVGALRVGQCRRSRRAIGVVRCCTPASTREPIESSAGSNPSCRLRSIPS